MEGSIHKETVEANKMLLSENLRNSSVFTLLRKILVSFYMYNRDFEEKRSKRSCHRQLALPYSHTQKSTEMLMYSDTTSRTGLWQKTNNNNAYTVWNMCLQQTRDERKEAKAKHKDHRAGAT